MIIDIDHFGTERRIDGSFRIKISQEDARILLAHLQHALSDWSDGWMEINDSPPIPISERPDINPRPKPDQPKSPEQPISNYFVYGTRHKPVGSMTVEELEQYIREREYRTLDHSRLRIF